jgi:hypothetical protein
MNCVKRTWWGADPVTLMRFYKALIRSRMENRALPFHKLQEKQLQKLEEIQYRAIRGALGYRSSTLTNIRLAEDKEIPVFCMLKQLGRNYVSRCHTLNNHPMVQLLEELSIPVDNPGRGENELITPLSHLVQSGNCALAFNYTYKSLYYEARVSFDERRQINEMKDHNEEFKKKFHEKKRTTIFSPWMTQKWE